MTRLGSYTKKARNKFHVQVPINDNSKPEFPFLFPPSSSPLLSTAGGDWTYSHLRRDTHKKAHNDENENQNVISSFYLNQFGISTPLKCWECRKVENLLEMDEIRKNKLLFTFDSLEQSIFNFKLIFFPISLHSAIYTWK